MADSRKILVSGATGNVGTALLSYLDTTENDVRVLTHDESKAQSLRDQGLEVVVGDLSQQDTLGPAVVGVDTVFLLTPPVPEQVSIASNAIKAAKTLGNNPRLVRLSVMQASHDAPTRISRQHAVIEDEIKSSGLPYTLLRPHYYMQNTLMAAHNVASEGRVYQPFKDGKLGMIDVREIGEVAAKVLTEEGHEGKTYTLTGPASISFYDVAEALSEILDKEVEYVDISPDEAKESLLIMGFSEWMVEALNEYAKAYGEGYGDFTTDDVEHLTGHPATSYKEFASDFAQMFREE
jgi:uncharacterized protein YbjT (DUF2867 family)